MLARERGKGEVANFRKLYRKKTKSNKHPVHSVLRERERKRERKGEHTKLCISIQYIHMYINISYTIFLHAQGGSRK